MLIACMTDLKEAIAWAQAAESQRPDRFQIGFARFQTAAWIICPRGARQQD